MKRKSLFLAAAVLALCAFTGAWAEGADTLALPAGITAIEAEAFYSDAALYAVVIPEGASVSKARRSPKAA